jgi:hypothetical protein
MWPLVRLMAPQADWNRRAMKSHPKMKMDKLCKTKLNAWYGGYWYGNPNVLFVLGLLRKEAALKELLLLCPKEKHYGIDPEFESANNSFRDRLPFAITLHIEPGSVILGRLTLPYPLIIQGPRFVQCLQQSGISLVCYPMTGILHSTLYAMGHNHLPQSPHMEWISTMKQ